MKDIVKSIVQVLCPCICLSDVFSLLVEATGFTDFREKSLSLCKSSTCKYFERYVLTSSLDPDQIAHCLLKSIFWYVSSVLQIALHHFRLLGDCKKLCKIRQAFLHKFQCFAKATAKNENSCTCNQCRSFLKSHLRIIPILQALFR